MEGNALIIGALGGGGNFVEAFGARWHALGSLGTEPLLTIAVPALTLAVLLSIDTLKTCVVLDALTRTRHNSNRELIGQGVGNPGVQQGTWFRPQLHFFGWDATAANRMVIMIERRNDSTLYSPIYTGNIWVAGESYYYLKS